MFRCTALALFMLGLAAGSTSAQDSRSISEGQTLSGSLSADSAHVIMLQLDADQFVYGAVDQLSVDVVVTITGDEGPVGRFDTPSRGEERFTFESDQAGTYTINLESFEDGSGDYTITIHEVEDVADDPEARVDQLMSAYDDEGTPGAIVGVVEDGRLVFEKGYGMANLTWDVPFDEGMRSNIGSVTKQFTAMGLLLLEQEGKLSLDDEVRTHIPELPDFGTPVTLRHLLNHVGGFRELYNAYGMMGYDGEDAFARDKVIQLVQRQPELQAPPNTEFNYNNTGYILVSMTIERVSGMRFQEYMRERVFEPLGMANTLITNHQGQIIPNSAMGYVPVEEGGYRQARDLAAAAGAGGIYTTAEDIARWMLNYRDQTVGGADAIAAITTNTTLESGDSTGYGLGLGLATHRGRTVWAHTGGDVAHRTYFGWYPELESGVFVSSNNAGFPTSVGRPLAEAFFGDEMDAEEEDEAVVAAEMSDERKEAIVGLWRLAAGLEIQIDLADGELSATPQGQSTTVLVPTSDSTVSVTGVEASVTFHFESDGSTESAVLHQGGDNPMSRVGEESELTEEMLTAYEGRYWSDEMEIAFEVIVEDGELLARNFRLPAITLEPGVSDTFAAGVVGAFEFKRAGNGTITGFMVNNARTRDVWFEREWVPGG